MGVNGQAQYWARDIDEACHILFRHYEHTYVLAGERFPRQAETADPIDRDVQSYPHNKNGEEGFAWVGEILSNETNPGRKRPFDIRRVMKSQFDGMWDSRLLMMTGWRSRSPSSAILHKTRWSILSQSAR